MLNQATSHMVTASKQKIAEDVNKYELCSLLAVIICLLSEIS